MVLLLLAFGCGSSAEPDVLPSAPKGMQKVAIGALTAEIGSQRALPRIYNFWATWCAPCIRELPILKQFAEEHDEVELVLINVDLPKLHDTKVKRTLTKLDLDGFRNLALVDDDPAYALLQVPGWPSSVPVTMIVGADGTLSQQYNRSVSAAMLDKAVAEAH